MLTRQTSYTLGKLELFEGSLGRGDEDVSQAFFEIELILSVHRKNQDKCNQHNHDAQNNSNVLAVAQERAQRTQDIPPNLGQKHAKIEQIGDSNHSLSHGILTLDLSRHSVTTHLKSAKFAAHLIMKLEPHKVLLEFAPIKHELHSIHGDR